MDFFGVGLFEILLVLVFGLIVLGPERLQTLGRTTGRLVAQWLAFQQASPELQAVQRIRAEFEAEINALRDEIVRARQQIDVSHEVQRLRDEGRSISQFPAAIKEQLQSTPPADLAAPTPNNPPAAESPPDRSDVLARSSDVVAPTASETLSLDSTSEATAASPRNGAHADPPTEAAPANLDQEVAALRQQVATLTAELHSLRRLLAKRGIVDTSYTPPKEPVQQ